MGKVARQDPAKGYTVSVTAGAKPGPTPESAGEFANFERLAEQIVKVPKSELDEKLRES